MRLHRRLHRCCFLLVPAFSLLLGPGALPARAQSDLLRWDWTSTDTSRLTVNLLAGDTFRWKNPDGSEIFFQASSTAGTRTLMFDDTKTQKGTFVLPLGALNTLLSASYGLNGEPPITSQQGQITGATGQFTLAASAGFLGINAFSTTFNAALISSGTDNPLTMSLLGQGNQLSFPTPGTLSYTTRWRSSDSFLLSNGQTLALGDFYLSTSAAPSAFSYSVGPDGTFVSDFVITEKYQFVTSLSAPPVGNNLRFEMDGSRNTVRVTGVIAPEPSPAALLASAGALCGLPLASRAVRRRRRG